MSSSTFFLAVQPTLTPPPTTKICSINFSVSSSSNDNSITHFPEVDKLAFLIDKSKSLKHIHQIHAALLRHNLHNHPILNLKLQRRYTSFGRLDYSVSLFQNTQNCDVFSWTSIIHGHTQWGLSEQALIYYEQMLTQGVQPNAFTFSSLLKACSFQHGRTIHSQAMKFGLDSNLFVRTGLLKVYARGGNVESAKQLFDTMPERSLISITAMLTCYAKRGQLQKARALFDCVKNKDVVVWNVMIDGYTQNGFPKESLLLFRKMLRGKIKPNELTMVSVLSSCGQLGSLDSGRWVHSYMENRGLEMNVLLGTALVDMYSKCGSLEDAIMVFNTISDKDAIAWNSMIMGYAMHGYSEEAFNLFDHMCTIGHKPTDITFIGILTACSYAGLVKKGWEFFNLMKDEYRIEPKIEHYGCMVNLLGLAGHLEEAYELIKNMKMEPDPVMWGTLLGACRIHSNISVGEKIADFLVGRNLANSGIFVLLSNLYAASGNWDGAAKVRMLMRDKGVDKEPGCSSIEVNNEVHEFVAGDSRHPKNKEIYLTLEKMDGWLKTNGHVPQTDIVLHDLGERQREQSLQVHSEKLAIAFGLISTRPGTTMKIIKNLRVCSDCHSVTKLISKITGRKIIMRDRHRFHHFVDGSCSCGDHW